MNNLRPFTIIILLSVVLFLLILNICLPKINDIEQFTSTSASTEESSNYNDYTKNPKKLLSMFKSLEEAEKKCEQLESQQIQREEKYQMRENDKTYKQLQEQDKQIHELKEIVKYLTIEKKRRDKINNKCKENKQRKLNEQYDVVKSLNDSGFLRDNSVKLDLNISDSAKIKNLLSSINNKGTNVGNSSSKKKCKTSRGNKVNIDKIGLDKCYGCDADKLSKIEGDIQRDFE